MRLPDKSPPINEQPALRPRLIELQCLRTAGVKLRLPLWGNAPLAWELRLCLERVMACIERDILKRVLGIL